MANNGEKNEVYFYKTLDAKNLLILKLSPFEESKAKQCIHINMMLQAFCFVFKKIQCD